MTLLLCMAAEAAPLVEAEPARVVLGAGSQVRIAVRGPGNPLRGAASAGTLVQESVEAGLVRFLWTPPPTRAPFVAVFAFWEGGPLGVSTVTTLTIPCSGRTELAIDTEPGARVTVEIAGAHFGPRRSDARGKLRMPVEVPPQAHEARITAEIGEQGKVRVVPLPVATSPWVWLVEPASLHPDAEGQAMLVAPEEISSELAVQASGGRLDRQASEPDRMLYRVSPQPGASQVALEATLPGEGRPRASTIIEVRAPSPEATPPTPQVTPAGRQLELGAAVGVFYAGGKNVGPAFEAVLSVAPWRLPLYLEFALGIRAAWFSNPVPSLGTASSTLVVFPIDLAVRGQVWHAGHWSVELRAGGGLLLGTNWVSSDFGQSSSRAATGWEVFGAAQIDYQAGVFQPFVEVRGAYAVATGTGLTANPGGLIVLLGFHWIRGLR